MLLGTIEPLGKAVQEVWRQSSGTLGLPVCPYHPAVNAIGVAGDLHGDAAPARHPQARSSRTEFRMHPGRHFIAGNMTNQLRDAAPLNRARLRPLGWLKRRPRVAGMITWRYRYG
jgi:hypothetical protein